MYVRNHLFGLDFCVVPGVQLTLTKTLSKVFSTKPRVFISLVGPWETFKSLAIFNWLTIGAFQLKIDKIYFFHQHLQPFHDLMKKETDVLKFVQGVSFKVIDSLKNNIRK